MIFKVKSETDRLILADWFEEQGKDDVAHFIRMAEVKYKSKSLAGSMTIRLSDSVSDYLVIIYFDSLYFRLYEEVTARSLGCIFEEAIGEIICHIHIKDDDYWVIRGDKKYGWLIELAIYYLGVANEWVN